MIILINKQQSIIQSAGWSVSFRLVPFRNVQFMKTGCTKYLRRGQIKLYE